MLFPSPSVQRGLHVSLRAAGSASVFGRAAAGLPHALHGRRGLHQRHGDLHRLGQRDGPHRLGPSAITQEQRAGGAQHRGAELRRASVSAGQHGPRRALAAETLELSGETLTITATSAEDGQN